MSASANAAGRKGLGTIDRLYGEHAGPALRLAYLLTGDRPLAEDLVHDAFIRLFSRFRHLREPESFGAYLNRTIVNHSRDHHRRRGLENRHLERERATTASSQPGPAPEDRYVLLDALNALPVRQRAAVVLHHYQDMSERQVAEALDCSLGAAKALIARGMESLRAHMEVAKR